ncbi:hypothetical protein B0T20DRAFT_26240 [Sordaria brevicollis]|uniref:CENP-V/GFA domain-containing protein n=1 Tax=Sordaria brevicollis TaxID=83679 RepID=A0AAE0PNS9_SORBR|nr:hypothetical protein B0T20DRAFT_26240 [Sordaria brevicollis]
MASSGPENLTSAPPTEMSADKRHAVLKGNCHCGRHRFEYKLPVDRKLQDEAVKCSCRLCFLKGYIWLPVRESTPSEGELIWTQNDGELIKNSSPVMNNEFCGNCGTGMTATHFFGPLKDRPLVNLRAIQGVDIFFLDSVVKTINIKEELPHEPLSLRSSDVLYNGSCFCRKVQVELLRHEQAWEVKEDNCSSCVRDAYVGIYPTKEYVRIPEEAYNQTFEYRYNSKGNGIRHCSSCGVMVFMTVDGPPGLEEMLGRLKEQNPERYEQMKKMVDANLSLQPLNLRTLEMVDWEEMYVRRVVRSDVGTAGYVLAEN